MCSPLIQVQQTWKQVLAESLACLSWQQTGQMVDGNHAELRLSLQLNWHGWFCECSSDSVYGDRVVWIGSIGADIADDRELPVWYVEALEIDEVGDLRHQVYAVDEDIALDNLGERSALSCLCHIPLQHIL